MPRPLPPIISETKSDLVSIFRPYLLSKMYGYSTTDPISKCLINDIIQHKSFGAAFTYEVRNSKMKVIDISMAIDNLVNAIYDYFSKPALSTSAEFDNWEKKVGNGFLDDCKSYRTFNFGKAQKIINVTIKHLYCYSVSEDYFKFCHVALDSMTYTGRSSNALDGGFYKYEVNPGTTTKSFSNLAYDEYIQIQNEIRDYLNSGIHQYITTSTHNILTPFKAEFYIWPRYKK